jgi:(heptosyl)LPS beta-1,4-glucosyltransferase
MAKISVVINTLNEEKRLAKTLSSLKDFASEIVVVDMQSTDLTVEIAKKAGAKVYRHKRISYVEPARNFGIEKAKHEWVLILDADERLSEGLKAYLKEQIKKSPYNYFRIPRKNIIFEKWMKHTGWWPDYNIRFFKKGTVSWNEIIHSVPTTTGNGFDIPADGDLSIIHDHYSSIEEYLLRMNRYTTVQAKHLNKEGVTFNWRLLISKPASQFLTRYFAQEGFKDGVHGLATSCLQAFSELVLYLKLWQKNKFDRKKISLDLMSQEFDNAVADLEWWVIFSKIAQEKSVLRRLWLKVIRKLKYL